MAKYVVKKGGMHEAFLNCRKKVQIIGGGFGNGKTAAACIKAIQLANAYPGSNGLVGMATFTQLDDTIKKEFFKWLPPASVSRMPTTTNNTVTLNNGSMVNFRYISQKGKKGTADGGTSSNLLSATYDYAIIDQIEDPRITHKDFLDIFGRLRGSTPRKSTDISYPDSGPRWLIAMANPSFNWVYSKIIKPWHDYKAGAINSDLIVDPHTNEPMIEVFEGSTYENAHNLPEDFITGLEATFKGQMRQRYLMGEWGAFEGLVYPNFDQRLHCMTRAKIMSHLIDMNYQGFKPESIEGFDFGIASPSCYLFGFVDYLGRIFILDGFYKKEMSLQEINDRIKYIQSKYESLVDISAPIEADPAIFRRTIMFGLGKGTDTIATMLSGEGLLLRPGQNDIMNGIAKISSYLAMTEFPHFETGERNGCLFYCAVELRFLVDEFLSYFWKTNGSNERIDEPTDRNDHAMDTLKYMVSRLPNAGELLFQSFSGYGAAEWNKMLRKQPLHRN